MKLIDEMKSHLPNSRLSYKRTAQLSFPKREKYYSGHAMDHRRTASQIR